MIKQIFGVMKKCFKVLTLPQEYNLETQAQIVCALGVVNNFMKVNDPDDPLFKDSTLELDPDMGDTAANRRAGSRERARAAARREKIARDMWKDYRYKKRLVHRS